MCTQWFLFIFFSLYASVVTTLVMWMCECSQLAEAFGADWAMQRIEPMIAHMCEHHNYLFRMTALFAISALVQVTEGASIAQRLAKTGMCFSRMWCACMSLKMS